MNQLHQIYAFAYRYRIAILYSILLHIVFVAIFSIGVEDNKTPVNTKPSHSSMIPVATIDANKVQQAMQHLKVKDEKLQHKKRMAKAEIASANQARIKEENRLESLKKEYQELQNKHSKQKQSVKSEIDKIYKI